MSAPTGEKFTMLVDDEDYELMSRLTWYAEREHSTGKWRPVARVAPHRLLLDAPLIDHINRDPMDNRKINLRPASYIQNSWNQGIRKNNTSGFKGVHKRKDQNRYRAKINVSGQQINLGSFVNPIDAAKAYDAAAREYYGEFAWLNFPAEVGDV